MGIGLMVFAPEVILGFFPAKCEVVIAPMVILTVFALCRALGTTLSDLAKGVGKPYVLTQAAFWHMVLMVPILYAAVNLVPWSLAAATRLGGLDITASSLLGFLATLAEQRISLVAVSVGVSGTAIFAIGLTFQLCAREVQITPRYVFESLRPALAAGLAMALAGLAARELVYLVVHPNRLGRMVALVVAGGVSCAAYGAWLWFRSPEVVSDLRKMLERRRAEGGRKKAAKNPPAPVA
jgi:hypothetical protein